VAEHLDGFPISAGAERFRRRFYPGCTIAEWNDWQWQARNRIRTLADISRILVLSEDERAAIARHDGPLPLGVTPYYAHLFDEHDATQALRRTHLPALAEAIAAPGESDDPLGENDDMVVPGLVHRYPDRVLFLVTGFCSTYCRYCTRSRLVGHPGGEHSFTVTKWERALDYLAKHGEVRDVLLSGGDPLTIHDDKLDWLLARLRAIPHIELIRLGTKIPLVLPQRITRDLANMLRRHRVWLSVHATHPDELTEEAAEACDRLSDAGVPLGSQTVLLRGVNDDPAVMKAMLHGLLRLRIKPYYLYQCDPISGSAHFRTPVASGLALIDALRGHTSGYAIPHYVVDAPGGGGKIPLLPDPVVGRDGDDLLLRNYEGAVFRYPDPVAPAP
jgi:lysine 2,3-aminomutase